MKGKIKNQKIKQETVEPKVDTVFFDLIALFFVIGFLAIDFLPNFNSIEIVSPQYLYLAFINILMGFYFYKNPALITQQFVSVFKSNYAISAYMVFLLICGLSIFIAKYFSLAIISWMQLLIVFFLFINLSLLLFNRLYLINRIVFIVVMTVFIQCVLEINHFIESSKAESITAALSNLKGNTGSINIFAANLVGKIPFLLFGIFVFSKWKKWLTILTLFLATLLILLTASRASFLGLSIEIVVFIALLFKINSDKKTSLLTTATIVLPLIVAFFTANIIFEKGNNSGRFSTLNNRITQTNNITDRSTNERLNYWQNALQIIEKNPVLGIGIGNWKVESIPYEKFQSNNIRLSEHTHNDFLEITSETGLLNGLVFLSVFVIGLFINMKKIIKESDIQSRLIALLTLLMIITYGIDALLNFPLHRPTMQINLGLFLVLTLINVPKTNSEVPLIHAKKGILMLILLSVITIYFSFIYFKANQLEYDIKVDSNLPENQQVLTSDYLLTRMPLLIEFSSSSQTFSEMLGKLYLKEKNYNKAHACFNLSEKINPYLGQSDYFRYKIAKERGIVDSAYIYAKKAFDYRPRCESFYLASIVAAIMKKDTVNILKVHEEYSKYRNNSSNWINTSSALIQSKYSNKNLINFLDEGLRNFPEDSTLLQRRSTFNTSNNLVYADKLAKESNFKKALEVYMEINKQDPTNMKVIQNIGICYLFLKQFKTAILNLEKTLNSQLINDGRTEYYLGICYIETRNNEKGCFYINIASNKKYPDAKNFQEKYCK